MRSYILLSLFVVGCSPAPTPEIKPLLSVDQRITDLEQQAASQAEQDQKDKAEHRPMKDRLSKRAHSLED